MYRSPTNWASVRCLLAYSWLMKKSLKILATSAVRSGDAAHCASLLSDVRHMAEGLREALLSDLATEIIPMGLGGAGVQGGIEQALSRDDAAKSLTRDEDEDEDS